MIPILFGMYWGVAGFALLFIVHTYRKVTAFDALLCLLVGGIILPAAAIANMLVTNERK